MKAYKILLLLCWIQFMGTALSEVPTVATSNTAVTSTTTDEDVSTDPDVSSGNGSSQYTTETVSTTANSVQPKLTQRGESTAFSAIPTSERATSATSDEPIRDTSEASGTPNTDTATSGPLSPTSSSAPPSPNTQTTPRPDDCLFSRKKGQILLMVTGVLIIACVILLLTTVMLACKLCQVRRHDQGSNADLISNSDYWMGTAQRNRCQSETVGVETSVLMSPLSQGEVGGASAAKKQDTGKLDVEVIKELEAGRNKKEAKATPDQAPVAGGMVEQTSGAGNSSSSKKTVGATNTVASSPSENETKSAAVLEV